MKEKRLFDIYLLSGNNITTIERVITENILLRVKNCENESLKWLYLGRTWLYNLRSENMCTQSYLETAHNFFAENKSHLHVRITRFL